MTGNLGLIGFIAVQVVFLVRTLGLPAVAVGLLLAALGVVPFCLLAPLASRGPGLALYVIGVFMTAVGVVISNVIVASFRQAYSPPGMLGRASATMRFLVIGTSPLGALLGGALAAAISPRGALWVLYALISAAGLFLRSPRLPTAGTFRPRRRPAGNDLWTAARHQQ